jgi:hypothetical protein
MSVKKVQKKLVISLLILSIFLTGNCFGKFSLVRKIYEINSDITLGQQGKMGGVIKSIFMILFLILPVYSISAFVDVILFNVIEFWTDKNPLALNDKINEELVSNNGTSITKKINGNRMDLVVKNNEKIETIILFKDKPGKFYTEKRNQIEEIKLNSMEFGLVSILSMDTSNESKKQMIPTQLIEEVQSKHLSAKF